MRICVYGAGSVGGNLAVRLWQAGGDVAVIARGGHLEAIQKNGLTLLRGEERHTAKPEAASSARDIGMVDAVIVTLKATGLTETTAADIAHLLKPETPVIFALNGLPWWYFHGIEEAHPGAAEALAKRMDPGGVLARHIGLDRAVGCVINSANEVIEPGVVRNNTPDRNRFALGEPDGSISPRIKAVEARLLAAGYEAPVTSNIRQEIWGKLMVNLAGGPMACLTLASTKASLKFGPTAAVYRALLGECIAVAAAYGVDISEGVEEKASPDRFSDVHRPSIRQDMELGRPMEVDAIVASVQDLARAAGVSTPTLDVILALLMQRATVAGSYQAH